MRALLLTLCLFGTLGVSHAQAQDCATIKDDKERLACFDARVTSSAPPSQIEAPKTVPPGFAEAPPRDVRARYANELRHSLLSSGESIEVWSWETRHSNRRGHDALKQYPRLAFYGFMTQAMVYQLLVDGHVMENARRVGFKGIEFWSTAPLGSGRGGVWWWDTSKAEPPKCDIKKRLCL